MVEFVIVAGLIWLGLTLFEPLVWWLDAGKSCDQHYAWDRIQRAQRYEELAESHSMSPLYQQMKQEKRLNHKERQKARRRAARAHLKSKKMDEKNNSGAIGTTSAPNVVCLTDGKAKQKTM